jgi:imidazolonepropionase-like amidohydrolase
MLKSPGLVKNFAIDDEYRPFIARLGVHLKKFCDLGGIIVAGTDTGNPYRIAGLALHEEIAFYVRSGITPIDALRTATVNAARLVGDEGKWGSIKPGLAADLVVLEKDPLKDINNTLSIVDVIKAGKVVDRKGLPLR